MTRTPTHKRERLLAILLVTTLLASSFLTTYAQVRRPTATMAVPQLVSPANLAHTTGNPNDPNTSRQLYEALGIPTFEWQDVGASKYNLEVATTAVFGDSTILDIDDIQYTTYTPTGFESGFRSTPGFGLTDDGSGNFIDQAEFYWRVAAWDDVAKAWDDYSEVRQFTRHWGYKPTLLYPLDNSIHDKTPYFEWDPVPGASFYQIQIGTDPGLGTPLVDKTTDVPSFSPTGLSVGERLENDEDLFWRVRAFHRPNYYNSSGGRGGEWSEEWQFVRAWASITPEFDTRPTLLIPPNGANHINRPLLCWQPVAGAAAYRVYLSKNPDPLVGPIVNGDFPNGKTEDACYTFARDNSYALEYGEDYYWAVVAEDAIGNIGETTNEQGSAFRFTAAITEPPTVPNLFYPPYYYTPVMSDTFEDRTVAVPTFVWDHVEGASTYQLCIDDNVAMSGCDLGTLGTATIVTTANASFTFTDTNTYPLSDGQVYYWKVRSDLSPGWGQANGWDELNNKWKVRVDRQQLQVTSSIQLIKPTYQVESWAGGLKYGQESVTYYPSFAWSAVAPAGSASYQIQIAYDSGFSNVAHDAQTDFTEYTPTGLPAPGTYYWRVRMVSPATGDWSESGRFTVSRNFTYQSLTVDGDPSDWSGTPLAFYAPSGENSDTSGAYDLSGFYVAAVPTDWYLGIPISSSAQLGIYWDVDHLDNSGATSPPSGFGGPSVPPAHQPEYYIYWNNSTYSSGRVYQWSGSAWDYLGTISSGAGGSVAYDAGNRFLELNLKATSVGQPGSPSLQIFTLNGTTVMDRLPNLPGEPTQAAFLTESTTPTSLFPANAPNDVTLATVERSTPVLTWRHNQHNDSPMYPFYFQTSLDDGFSSMYEGEQGRSPRPPSPATYLFWNNYTYWAPQVYYSDNDSYFWRIQRLSYMPTKPNHFIKQGFVPTGLQFSPVVVSGTITYTNRTPRFNWQVAQGSPRYVWQLLEGGEVVEEKELMSPSYTPRDAIPDGTYTWKVWAQDPEDQNGAEAAQGVFSKVSDVVSVHPVEHTATTLVLSWDPVDYAAYYEVLIDEDPNFSSPNTNETCNTTFTPEEVPSQTIGGNFYVRVRMVDNDNNKGPDIDLNINIYPEQIFLPLVLK
jgi:hypothetical protein